MISIFLYNKAGRSTWFRKPQISYAGLREKSIVFWFKLQINWFLKVQLIINQHYCRDWLGTEQAISHVWRHYTTMIIRKMCSNAILANTSVLFEIKINSYVYIYIYYPLYTNWPITNADLPHVIIQYILYFICQKLYWTVSGQLSNIGYIGQFQNEATGTLRTRYRRTEAVSMYLMKILLICLHLRKILKPFA